MPATRWSRPSSRLSSDTARPGADATLGGFGGLFDLKAAGFNDPMLVAANDGVGTKLKIAIETGPPRHHRHRSRRDVRQRSRRAGRRAAVLPRLLRDRQARRPRSLPAVIQASRRLPAGRLRADRRRNRGNAGHVRSTATTILPAFPSARSSAAKSCRAAISRPATSLIGLAVVRRSFERLFAGAARR